MTIERKVGMGIAGQPSGPAADVAEVFSTFLYTAGSAERKVNGIDLSGEGGMVWTKSRTSTGNHRIQDTVRGKSASGHYKNLKPNSTAAEETQGGISTFHSDGYSIDNSSSVTDWNTSTNDYASFTFRKKSGFFDCVTWTGNGVAGREIAHGLNGPVGMLVVKRTDSGGGWRTWHKSVPNKTLVLDETGAASTNSAIYYFGNDSSVVNPTSTNFTVGAASELNANGGTYVAYLFADNSAEDADDQMIKCGSYTGNQSSTGPVVNLGWEPQWLMVKQTTLVADPADWIMVDNMRGWATGSADARLYANSSGAENSTEIGIDITSTGFKLTTNGEQTNKNNAQYIYMAIRAPMMVQPSAGSATDVFAVDAAGSGVAPAYISGFPVDFAIYRDVVGSAGAAVGTRMLGDNELFANTTAAVAATGAVKFDFMDGHFNNTSRSANYYSWMWKRAKGYMDVVAYSGTGSATTVAHSLSVIPELMICKLRSSTEDWTVYNSTSGATKYLNLNTNDAAATAGNIWNDTAPTSTVFSVGTSSRVNSSGHTYIAYLFATLDGISKVGSVNVVANTTQNVDCGFSNGARFVLIKRSSDTGHWDLFDTTRGIVAGNDPRLQLNRTNAQYSGDDYIDISPYTAGFTINGALWNSGTYIFYAIA